MLSQSHSVSQLSSPPSVRLLVSYFGRSALSECTGSCWPECSGISLGAALSMVGGPLRTDSWWERLGKNHPPHCPWWEVLSEQIDAGGGQEREDHPPANASWLWLICRNLLFPTLRKRDPLLSSLESKHCLSFVASFLSVQPCSAGLFGSALLTLLTQRKVHTGS